MPGKKKGKKFMVSKKVYGEQEGKLGRRKNLVAGRRKKEKKSMAPVISKGSLNAVGFEQWLNQHLLPSLKIPSLLLHG
jgi:putative transposase